MADEAELWKVKCSIANDMGNLQRTSENRIQEINLELFASSCLEPKWYAVHTCAQHEKRVAFELERRDIHCFLPTYRSLRRWKDRRVELDFPLFPGYLFVLLDVRKRSHVLTVPGVVRMVGFGGQPLAIPADEIKSLQAAVQIPQKLAPHPYLTKGCRVRVRYGPLKGAEGILVRKKKQCRLVLSLHLITSSVSVEVDSADVELLR